ncbi:MAG: FkbM family methyltransferase [Actinomycetota bacterium]|nr:FkbM family methyltransferase [Actinomycetota bacterium]
MSGAPADDPGGAASTGSSVAVSPGWARAYRRYALGVPAHPGKRRLLRVLHGFGLRSRRPFACQMINGAWLAIRPEEGLVVAESVGWTCFIERAWDPHVEACVRTILRPGQTAIDVGANLGYFTAVMAQCVGPDGRVWSFEPVPETFELLTLCKSLNDYPYVTPIGVALGAADGSTEITYDRRHSGIATIHPDQVAGEPQQVPLRALDALVSAGEVGRPDLIKVDVEGHEFDVLRGARETIREASPTIVFELNERAARAAGWTLAALAELLLSLGDYSFSLIDADGTHPLDPFTFRLERDERLDPHVDVLAQPARAR